MQKLSKFSFLFLGILVAIALGILFVSSSALTAVIHWTPWQVQLTLLLVCGLAAGVGVLFLKVPVRVKIWLLLLDALAMRLVWNLWVPSVPVSDFATIYEAAKGFLKGNVGPLRDYGYLARFPHLVPMMVYMMGMIRLFGEHHMLAMKCVSVALSVLSVYLIYLLSGYYVKKQNVRLLTMLLAVLFPSFISYSSTFCTETIGVPLFLTAVLLFHKACGAPKKQWLWFLACGAVLYCSNMFRGVAIVFMIAFGIYLFIFTEKRRILHLASVIAGYAVVALCISTILMGCGVIEQPLWEAKEPSYATLMLKGSNFESHGAWNEEDALFVEAHLKDENLSALCFEVIGERLRSKPVSQVALFYGSKFVSQWSVGDCNGTYWATMQTDTPYNFPLPIPFQFIYVCILLLCLLSFVTTEQKKPLALMFLLLCGFGTAFIMLETQGRYSYVSQWTMLMLAGCGMENISLRNPIVIKLKPLYEKHKMMINYLFFGVVTTVVNIVVYTVCYNALHIPNVISTVIAWLLSVIVAYITNKIWVFESKSFCPAVLWKELASFFGCRLLSGVFDVGIMWLGVDVLCLHSTAIKILSNVIVIIFNYVVSKLLIFKEKPQEKSGE